jgi:hypothetical protein
MALWLKADIARRLELVPVGSLVPIPGQDAWVAVEHPPTRIMQLCNRLSRDELFWLRRQLPEDVGPDQTALTLREQINALLPLFQEAQAALTNDAVFAEINASDDRDELATTMRNMASAATVIGDGIGEQRVRGVLHPKAQQKYNKALEYAEFIDALPNDPSRPSDVKRKRGSSQPPLASVYASEFAAEKEAQRLQEIAEQEEAERRLQKKPRSLVPELVTRPAATAAQQPAAPSPPRTTPESRQPTGFTAPPAPVPVSAPPQTDGAAMLPGDVALAPYRMQINEFQAMLAATNEARANKKSSYNRTEQALQKHPDNPKLQAQLAKLTKEIATLDNAIAKLTIQESGVSKQKDDKKVDLAIDGVDYTDSLPPEF